MHTTPDPERRRKRRHLADTLSLINLLCGMAACVFAATGQIAVCLLLLGIGAACDGLDGACARRFGGTRLGVLADDVADGVNYGLAPSVALAAFAVPHVGLVFGILLGLTLFAFTVSRLVFFTLRHGQDDAAVFRGVPSTFGAVVVYGALLAFSAQPLLVGFAVGVMCVLMVSFDTKYPHLGRALTTSSAVRRYCVYVAVGLAIAAGQGLSWLGLALLVVAFAFGLAPPFLQLLEAQAAFRHRRRQRR